MSSYLWFFLDWQSSHLHSQLCGLPNYDRSSENLLLWPHDRSRVFNFFLITQHFNIQRAFWIYQRYDDVGRNDCFVFDMLKMTCHQRVDQVSNFQTNYASVGRWSGVRWPSTTRPVNYNHVVVPMIQQRCCHSLIAIFRYNFIRVSVKCIVIPWPILRFRYWGIRVWWTLSYFEVWIRTYLLQR